MYNDCLKISNIYFDLICSVKYQILDFSQDAKQIKKRMEKNSSPWIKKGMVKPIDILMDVEEKSTRINNSFTQILDRKNIFQERNQKLV